MNILLDKLPKSLEIDNKNYEIETDFRTWIMINQLIQDEEINDYLKLDIMFDLVFKSERPTKIIEARDKIIEFYTRFKNVEDNGGGGDIAFDFEVDSDLIFTAFFIDYKIDLCDIEYMHWFKFMALFLSISENTQLSKIMQYRTMDLSKIKDKEQQTFYRNMKEKHKIKQKVSKEEEKLLEALKNGEDIQNLI